MDHLLGELRLSVDNTNTNLDNRTNVDMNGDLWSPDEFVIKQKGRRKTLAVDNNNVNLSPFQKTPTKMPPTSSMILRSSPRKRLTMGSTPDSLEEHSPMKMNAKQQLWGDTPTQAKRTRFNDMEITSIAQQSKDVPLATLLRGYSQTQLIQFILEQVNSEHKTKEEQFRAKLPMPNIDTFEKEIHHAKRNIYKSLPTSRLCRKTDSAAYSRASLYLNEFKRLLGTHLKELHDSGHWDAVIEYIFIAWGYVRSTPVWDNNSQNQIRRQCFKLLASYCITSVKMAGLRLGADRLATLEKNLQDWAKDYEDVLLCISTLNKTLTKGRTSL